MPNYSRGRDLGGKTRDSNLRKSKEWYAQSNMSLEEIRDEYIISSDRSMSTIRKHLWEIYDMKIILGEHIDSFPRCGEIDRYWVIKDYEEKRNGTRK